LDWNTEPIFTCPEQIEAAQRANLSDILAAIQALRQGADAEEQRRYLAIMHRAVCSTANIYHEQSLARRLEDEDVLRAYYNEMDLVTWCQEALEKASQLLGKEGVEVTFSCGEQELVTMADKELLDTMLYALISNAVKAAGKGCQVSVSLERRGENALLIVADQGEGFSSQALDRLLGSDEVQPDLTPGAGAGLGLNLSRVIAETHGGLLMVESSPGRGSRCAATLPIRLNGRAQLHTPQVENGNDFALNALADALSVESFYGE